MATETASLTDLIESLKSIEVCEEIAPQDFLTDGAPDELHPLLQKAVGLAQGDLITKGGHPHFANHNVLAASGFNVSKGESDSFGWLTGVIHTKKGKVVFG